MNPNPESTVASLPTKPRHHKWGDPIPFAADTTHNNIERTERTCEQQGCGMTKITMHPPQGYPWRQWRTKDVHVWHGEATPPCLGGIEHD